MITYLWTILQLDCLPDYEGQVDYCITAHWQCTGSDGTFSGQVYNTQSFNVTGDKPDFVPFDQLTEAQVVQWVQDALTPEGVTATETSIATQIENQVNPPIVSPPLPWAQPVPPAPDMSAPSV